MVLNEKFKVRVGDLKVGDEFIMDNTQYEVAKIIEGRVYYKTPMTPVTPKNNHMSQKSQKCVEIISR